MFNYIIFFILFQFTLSHVGPFHCPGNGVFADPDDCQCYYECANLIPSRMCCAAGTLFDDHFLVCDFDYHVNCGNRPKPGEKTTTTRKPTTTTPRTTTTTTTTTTITTTTTEEPMDCEQLCAGLDMDMFVSDECCSDSFCSCNEEFGKPQYSCPEGSYFCNAEQSCVTTSCSIRQCCSSDFVPTATSTSTTTTTTTDVCNNFQSGNCPLTEENIVGYMMSDTPAECQDICRQISECYYFTWFEKNCYLLYVCDQVSDCECCISGSEYPDVSSCPDLGC